MLFGVDYVIRELKPSDRINSFKTGAAAFAPLKSFLRNQAKDFHTGNIAKTYVAIKLLVDKDVPVIEPVEDDVSGILGYLTLTCSEIDIRNGYALEDCQYANRYESLPAVKIARLAVDERYRGVRVGENLVSIALAIAADVIAPAVGCRFVVTDAKSEAVKFYTRTGFTLLDTDVNRQSETPVMFIDLLPLMTE